MLRNIHDLTWDYLFSKVPIRIHFFQLKVWISECVISVDPRNFGMGSFAAIFCSQFREIENFWSMIRTE